MPVGLTEYLRSFRSDPSTALLTFYEGEDDSAFEFFEAIMATLYYQGKEINERNITQAAVEKIRRFYRKTPLEASHRLDALVSKIVERTPHPIDRSKKLFDWVVANVKYGQTKRGAVGYRTSLETFSSSEGVCGEMAILFVAMAGLAGVPSAYVSVKRDYRNVVVNHACASILNPETNEPILIDLSYKTFGAKHREYTFLDHRQLEQHFVNFRANLLVLRALFPD